MHWREQIKINFKILLARSFLTSLLKRKQNIYTKCYYLCLVSTFVMTTRSMHEDCMVKLWKNDSQLSFKSWKAWASGRLLLLLVLWDVEQIFYYSILLLLITLNSFSHQTQKNSEERMKKFRATETVHSIHVYLVICELSERNEQRQQLDDQNTLNWIS